MSFAPDEFQRQILAIVEGLQHGKGRQDVRTGAPIVLREGVPTSIILAEMFKRNHPLNTIVERVYAAVEELYSNELLSGSCTKHEQWRELNYKRPDGLTISTGISEETGNRTVYIDGRPVAEETAPGLEPKHDFRCYQITMKGLYALNPSHQPPEQARRWEPPSGYVGTKTIMSDKRFKKNGKNPPRASIQRWVERSNKTNNPVDIAKAPDSGESYYPEHWINEQIKLWQPQ